MSRFDKYDPYDGGFRAKLLVAIPGSEAGKIKAVSISAAGKVVIGGAGLVDIRGVICPTEAMDANAPIDVMTDGEIANATTTAGAAFTAGVLVYCHIDGTVDAVAAAGKQVGFMVELDRLIARCSSALTAT